MKNNSKAVQLRIYMSSTDKIRESLLYEKIVLMAKKHGLAGATVLKGILGYGASSLIHSYKYWEIVEKVPVVIEIIDEEEKIDSFYEIIRSYLEEMRYGCLVTRTDVDVILYKVGQKKLFD